MWFGAQPWCHPLDRLWLWWLARRLQDQPDSSPSEILPSWWILALLSHQEDT